MSQDEGWMGKKILRKIVQISMNFLYYFALKLSGLGL